MFIIKNDLVISHIILACLRCFGIFGSDISGNIDLNYFYCHISAAAVCFC